MSPQPNRAEHVRAFRHAARCLGQKIPRNIGKFDSRYFAIPIPSHSGWEVYITFKYDSGIGFTLRGSLRIPWDMKKCPPDFVVYRGSANPIQTSNETVGVIDLTKLSKTILLADRLSILREAIAYHQAQTKHPCDFRQFTQLIASLSYETR